MHALLWNFSGDYIIRYEWIQFIHNPYALGLLHCPIMSMQPRWRKSVIISYEFNRTEITTKQNATEDICTHFNISYICRPISLVSFNLPLTSMQTPEQRDNSVLKLVETDMIKSDI